MATLKNVTINDTGFLRLPSGTTAERPGSPVAGMIRYNTDINNNEFYNGSEWIPTETQTVGAASTGGSISSGAGHRIHTFTSGTSSFVPNKTGVVDVLVVGGGGGGHSISGGGGAGGLIYVAGVPVVAGTTYPVVIGTGGNGGTSHSANNATGGNPSTFGGGTPVQLVALGGARGRHYPPGPSDTGGSGGGGPGWGGGPERFHPGSSGTAGQGHPGGFGVHYNGTPTGTHYGGGGGGGAGTRGYNRHSRYNQARGGEGVATNISGSVVWRAGGGCGGYHNPSHGAAGYAGRGSTGNSLPGVNGSPGGTNLGGGGGGGPYSPQPQGGGPGGPGVVIVRYRD